MFFQEPGANSYQQATRGKPFKRLQHRASAIGRHKLRTSDSLSPLVVLNKRSARTYLSARGLSDEAMQAGAEISSELSEVFTPIPVPGRSGATADTKHRSWLDNLELLT